MNVHSLYILDADRPEIPAPSYLSGSAEWHSAVFSIYGVADLRLTGLIEPMPARNEDEKIIYEQLRPLIQKGILRWSGKLPPPRRPIVKLKEKPSLAEFIIQERE